MSADERHRNYVVYSWQGNRNPHDHPEFVRAIWGESCGTEDTLRDELRRRLERLESEINELRTIIEEQL